MSKGEEKIAQILGREGIRFEREKTFYTLQKGQYRYDFYICPNGSRPAAIVEYNGEQHYKYIPKFFKSQHEFQLSQGRDMKKISYCLSQNIPIYIIPYWEIEKIYDAADIFQDKFRANSKWKNYNDYDAYQKYRTP